MAWSSGEIAEIRYSWGLIRERSDHNAPVCNQITYQFPVKKCNFFVNIISVFNLTFNGSAPEESVSYWSLSSLYFILNLDAFFDLQVFVGGIPWEAPEQYLISAFQQFGRVQVEWPMSDKKGRGFCYIIFETEKQVLLFYSRLFLHHRNVVQWNASLTALSSEGQEKFTTISCYLGYCGVWYIIRALLSNRILMVKLPNHLSCLRCEKFLLVFIFFFEGERIHIIPWSFHSIFFSDLWKMTGILKNCCWILI